MKLDRIINKDISIPVKIDLDTILTELIWEYDDTAIIEIIKRIDEKVGSVDFTEILRDYFVEEMMKKELENES